VGKVRHTNEDAFGFFSDAAFYVVADGMGGHVGGEVASALAVEAMRASLQETQGEDLTAAVDQFGRRSVAGRRLIIAAGQANTRVLAMSQQHPDLTGMGTTIAAVLFEEEKQQVNICHVGDSRVYRVRASAIEQLTEDHSLVQQLVRAGKITRQDAHTHPHRHVLLQALGISPVIEATLRIEESQPDEVFVLCSDGIHGVVAEEEMLTAVRQSDSDPHRVCDTLVELANQRGGADNCTVLVLWCDHHDDE
jgi:protein phosphatase